MNLSRPLRLLFLGMAISFAALPSLAGVLISVNFAPPVLPVYVQPPCPQPGLLWTPGYWAYGPDGYYWVPGTWVMPPSEGVLWTPGYWGWTNGFFVFHDGYWGPHVGYYGGVNYGFGYMGIGFSGGMWRGHDFVYNTAVVHVDERFVHTTYIDRTIVERTTVVRDSHVAYSGGPGGIHHDPAPEERMAEQDRHITKTSFQQQHEVTASSDRTAYAKSNGGHPQTLASARPLAPAGHNGAAMRNPEQNQSRPAQAAPRNTPSAIRQNAPASRPTPGMQGGTQPSHPNNQPRPMSQPQTRAQESTRPQPAARPQTEARPQPPTRPQAEARPQPQAHPQNQARPSPPKGEEKERR